MYGIISIDEISFVSHGLFQNFRFALKNTFGDNFKNVNNADDLDGIDVLFIVDEHFDPHVKIWKNDTFINRVNDKNIKVVIFNFEKIYDALFPWNADHQAWVEKFKNLVQLVSDVNDAKKMGKTIVNKQLLSKDSVLMYTPEVRREDKVLFLGQISPHVYVRRKQCLQGIRNSRLSPNVDIINSDRKLTYAEYLTKLASYRWILNPLGTGDFLNLRFYEALRFGCIPIQQVTQPMIEAYEELKMGICYNFVDSTQLPDISFFRVSNFSTFTYTLEDYFEKINLKSMV